VPDPDADPESLKLSTDCTLFDDAGFLPLAEQFCDSQDAFVAAHAKAHKKLSELGAKFE
jgi:catalase (peroxidase I)